MNGREDPPLRGTEAELLHAFLDYQRATLGRKTSGLEDGQLARTLPPSTMTLAGMLKHLALVEDYWFSYVFAGNEVDQVFRDVDWTGEPDWEWTSAPHDEPAALRALHDGAVVHSRAVVDGESPEAESVRADRRTGEKFSLRWILLHMIEEYARHNGHADLIRESIDGQRGE